MKLHYSQTARNGLSFELIVLLPYEITLLSNYPVLLADISGVLLPYEITLLSNILVVLFAAGVVLLPYEITLLSNDNYYLEIFASSFTTI